MSLSFLTLAKTTPTPPPAALSLARTFASRKFRDACDVSAQQLYYQFWQLYNGLMAAVEYRCVEKLLLGSDHPFTQPGETLRRLRMVNEVNGNKGLPRIPEEAIEALVERDRLKLLGLE